MPTKTKAIAKPATKRVAAKTVAKPTPVVLTAVALGAAGAAAAVAINPAQVYRTKAEHNKSYWDKIQKAIAASTLAETNGPELAGAAAVAPMLETTQNPAGVPSHFFGYCLRRGYLVKRA